MFHFSEEVVAAHGVVDAAGVNEGVARVEAEGWEDCGELEREGGVNVVVNL